MKKIILSLLSIFLWTIAGFSQEGVAGTLRKDNLSVSTTKTDNEKASFSFAIVTNSNAEFTIQIFKNSVLYIQESKIPGTNLVMDTEHTAKLVAAALVKKLKQGQSTVFLDEEIRTLDNH